MKSFASIGIISALLASFAAQAAVVAVVDSGVDIQHPDFQGRIWLNQKERANGRDSDGNGFVDDLYGWNFINGNNKVLAEHLRNRFPADIFSFNMISSKLRLGTVTQQERAWLDSRRSSSAFMDELSLFGTYAHGTHVAGVAVENLPTAQILTLKMISTDPSKPDPVLRYGVARPTQRQDAMIREELMKWTVDVGANYASWARYLNEKNADVANCSFGIGTDSAERRSVYTLVSETLRAAPSREVVTHYARFFVGKAVEAAEKDFVSLAPKTLFVMAAGNDSRNNDVDPSAPANVRAANSITVAASVGISGRLASFSNFGVASVDVAAPGVAIRSQAPDGTYTWMSGTSMAAPYVTNIAARAKDVNKRLTAAQLKALIIGTVDYKQELRGRVRSGGVVNAQRAYRAAELSLNMPLQQAIQQARSQVFDQEISTPVVNPFSHDFASEWGSEEFEVDPLLVKLPSFL